MGDTQTKMLAFIVILSFLGIVAMMTRIFLAHLEARKMEGSEPLTEDILKQYDDLPSGMAIYLAWVEDGSSPRSRKKMKESVRAQMPVLARALDRMVEED